MGPSENSHYNENSNVSCKFPKAYWKPGVGERAPSHSRPYKGAIMSRFTDKETKTQKRDRLSGSHCN